MDAPIDEQVAHHAENDHQVQTEKKEIVVEQVVKAAKRRVQKRAGCDEHQPAMQLWLRAPINSKRHAHAKGDHVIERDTQESIHAALVELHRVKASHDDGGGDAQRNHHGGKPGAKPPNRTMPADFVDADQRRLKNEEDYPSCKSCAVNPEDEGTRHRGMKQVIVDRAPEAVNDNRRHQQRHRKIEVSLQKPVSAGERARFCL